MSATDVAHFPAPSLPEIAFLGRSNVGKSSVINTLVGKKLARTSNTPGRTRSINFTKFAAPANPSPNCCSPTCPVTATPRFRAKSPQEWARFVDPYLHQRPTLALCLALVDANIPAQESDRQLLEFLTTAGRPHVVVATKCDRMSGNELARAMRSSGKDYREVPIVPFSAKTGAGKDELWSGFALPRRTPSLSPLKFRPQISRYF